jgi:hypothetical protein
MVLRRCRYILVCDAGRDPKHGFEDLGNAIRKIRIDFGIPIAFNRRIEIQARSDDATRAEQSPGLFCAVAEIKYSVIDGTSPATDGWLVYVKPALRGRGAGGATDAPVPYDVFSYAQRSKDFPHETTNDQWFDEAQFESYRALGLHIVSQLTAGMRGDMTPSLPEFRWSVLDYMGELATEVDAAVVRRAASPPASAGSLADSPPAPVASA